MVLSSRVVTGIVPFVLALQLYSGRARADETPAASPQDNVTSQDPGWWPSPMPLPKSGPPPVTDEEHPQVTELGVWAGNGAAVDLIHFNLQGDSALVALRGGTFHQLDPVTGESRGHWSTKQKSQVTFMEQTLDDKRVVARHAGAPGLFIYNLANGTLERRIAPERDNISAVALGADPRLLAMGDTAGLVQVWNIANGKMLSGARGPRRGIGNKTLDAAAIQALAFSNDCTELYVAEVESQELTVLGLPGATRKQTIKRDFGFPVVLTPSWSGNWLRVHCDNQISEAIALRPNAPNRIEIHKPLRTRRVPCEPANMFAERHSNSVFCYFGGKAFRYYDAPLEPAGSSTDLRGPEGTSALAVTQDGKVAASGFRDGRVAFYKMPAMMLPVAERDKQLNAKLLSLLDSKMYDELDELANKSLTETQPDITERSPCTILTDWLIYVRESTDEGHKKQLASLREWLELKSESRAARYVLAEALIKYAWFLRGNDVAIRTSPEAMEAFGKQLQEADSLLQRADEMGPASAPICAARITVAMGLSKPQDQLLELWERGVKDTPLHAALHRAAATALLPRWGGVEGDVEKLAKRAIDELPGPAGLLAHAAIAMTYMRFEGAGGIIGSAFDLDTLEKSAAANVAAYPEGWDARNLYAVVACLRYDHAAASDRFLALGGDADTRLWGQEIRLMQRWSQSVSDSSNANYSFLCAWHGPFDLVAEGHKIITLGADPGQQLRVWDVDNKRLESTLPLPPGMLPSNLAGRGRYVTGMPRDAMQQFVVFDRFETKTLTWPKVTANDRAVITPDGGQMYVLNRKSSTVDFYNLTKPQDEPELSIPIDPGSMFEVEKNGDDWRLFVTERRPGQTVIHVLSSDGKDVREPIRLPAGSQASLRFRKTPRMLIGGAGWLRIMDIESGQITSLDEPQQVPAVDKKCAALAISRDETLAAVAKHPEDYKLKEGFELELWDLDKKQKLQTLRCDQQSGMRHLLFADDDKLLVARDEFHFIHVWNIARPAAP